jgi:hypothetical protein
LLHYLCNLSILQSFYIDVSGTCKLGKWPLGSGLLGDNPSAGCRKLRKNEEQLRLHAKYNELHETCWYGVGNLTRRLRRDI